MAKSKITKRYEHARSERDFMRSVIQVAKVNGWMVYHPYNSRRSAKGFPDLTMVRVTDGRLIFAELKVGRNKRTDAQIDWGIALESVGGSVEYHEWHPDDWSQICETLEKRNMKK